MIEFILLVKLNRPNVREYIDNLFDDFIELHGDRLYKDDGSIVGGLDDFNCRWISNV